jgi:hypothetical protein
MQIRDIISERQQQRTLTMYHGTSSKLVPSILKHGLLATAPKKTYDDDTYGSSVSSMGGVYIADNTEKANSIADDSIRVHGGEIAMVTIQYAKGSGDVDEDDLVAAIAEAAGQILRKTSQQAPKAQPQPQQDGRTLDFEDAQGFNPLDKYKGLSYPAEGWAADRMINNAGAAASQIAGAAIAVLSKNTKPSDAARLVIQQISTKLLVAAGKHNAPRERWNAIRYNAFEIIRDTMPTLMAKLMQQVSPDTPASSNSPGNQTGISRRLDRNVKFKGKTKIVKIEIGDNVVYPR